MNRRMLTVSIDPNLFARFPALRVGAFCATHLDRAAGTISARPLAPISGHDVDALPTTRVTIRTARPETDWFLPLGARPTDMPLAPDVLVYAAGQMVLCQSSAHCDSRQTCLRPETRRAVFFIDAVMPQEAPAREEALEDLRQQLAACGVDVSRPVFADTAAPDVTLEFDEADGGP
jgi:hypothetical protein